MRICRMLSAAAVMAAMLLFMTHGSIGQEGHDRIAVVGAIEGAIGPATVRHVEHLVTIAEQRDAEMLILRLNTPGGLADAMREIIASVLGSDVPVVGYVAPSGAHAASAGTYILYATHVAAMAPGTNLGAATPVQIGGLPGLPSPDEKPKEGQGGEEKGDGRREPAPAAPQDAMSRKAINDAVAFIRSLAELRGRNADWAEKAVREAASLSAGAAVRQNVADLTARDLDDLLQAIDGMTVEVGDAKRTLRTTGIRIEHVEADFLTEALGILSNPNVALLLLIIGVYGIVFEFLNPGTVGPGVVGAICLVLALYALNQLPLDYAGLALIALGMGLMIAEALTPTFGVLGGGGLVAFLIGAAMLVDTDLPQYRVSWWMIGVVGALNAAVLVLLVRYVWRAHRQPLASGDALMLQAEAEVIDWADHEGHVWAEGERWRASGPVGLSAGDTVYVKGMEGLVLHVKPATAEAPQDATADTKKEP